MAKTAGKQTAAPAAPATEEKKEARKSVFLNGISDKMIQPASKNGTAKDGKEWKRVGITLPEGKVGNIMVLPQQIKPAQAFSKGKDGETVQKPREGYSNILISGKVKVQFNEKDADGKYKTVEMTAEELKAQHETAVKEYRASKAKEAGRETPEIKEDKAAEAEAEMPEA